ncbi:MAG: hypothetical protein JWM34_5062 [Ilumatobacteraceae bacterium]|nr:hypothetical protein [Ilumatobacteraceae bacterium]
MNEPQSDLPDGLAERGILDRSQQAARFLDLTRQRALEPEEADAPALPLAAAHLRNIMAADAAGALDADDIDDLDADDLDADDIRIEPTAFGAIGVGRVPADAGLDAFAFDDGGDVFGDGTGFGSGHHFGHDDDPGDAF